MKKNTTREKSEVIKLNFRVLLPYLFFSNLISLTTGMEKYKRQLANEELNDTMSNMNVGEFVR